MYLRYRNATPDDLPEIVAIYNSVITSRMVTADTEPISVESRAAWFAQHSATRHPLWMVENEAQETVGWASFQSFYGRPAYASTAEISIYLAPAHRGQGLGKQVLQHCLASAPTLGIKTLLGFIFAHNQPSLQLFKNLGFEEWGFFPNIAELDGIERSLIIAGKRIV